MSSYNRIEKIKYTKNPSDVVALQEYIVFEDAKAEEKCVVFKFMNNLNQRLHELRFEVLQYDEEDDLLEKSVVVYDNFVSEPNAAFVPNAKLQINFACKSLRVNLVSAAFDRVKWENGAFSDNSYRFEDYAKRSQNPAPAATAVTAVKPAPAPQKIPKNGFRIKNVTRKNIAVFPKVFLAFVCIAVIVFVTVTLFLFKNSSKKFNIDGFDLEKVSEETVNICGYDGVDTELTIPAQIGKYTVHKIKEGAFKDCKIKTLNFKTKESVAIEGKAFENCNSLEKISAASGCGTITVMENAFLNCSGLKSVETFSAQLTKGSFSGCVNVKKLYFDRFAAGGNYQLIEVFGADVKEMSLDTVQILFECDISYFLENVKVNHFNIIA